MPFINIQAYMSLKAKGLRLNFILFVLKQSLSHSIFLDLMFGAVFLIALYISIKQ